MKTVTMHEAKTHLSRLVREAQKGEEIVIARGSQPVVRLVPIEEAIPARRFGTAKGLIHIHEDFDEPLEEFEEYS